MGRGWGAGSPGHPSPNVEMGYIAEPQDVDLVIAGGKLTAEDRRLLRRIIAKQKAKSNSKTKRAN